MAQFKSFDPKVEVSGQSILLLVEAMGIVKRMAANILAKYHITDITGKTWYSQQAYLDAFKEIYEKIGPKTIKTIGRQVPEKVIVWPPDIKTVEDALASIDKAYHRNNRGGEIGYYRFEKTGEHSGKMTCYNPFPCTFDEGLVEATVNKFLPPGKRVSLAHDEHGCRMKGGDACVYHLAW